MHATSFIREGAEPLIFSVNPIYPGKVETNAGLAISLTDGGSVYIYGKGRPYVLHTLGFEEMPSADYDGGFDYATGMQSEGTQSIIGWFLNAAPAGTSFSYIDAFGISHLVEFADAHLLFLLTSKGLYSGEVRLKEYVGQP